MAKVTLDQLKEMAINNGGKCLSETYVGINVPMLWECQEGHNWSASAHLIKNKKNWCPICGRKSAANKTRGNIVELKIIAQQRGGSCLSEKYINNHTKLTWKCDKGHVWETTPHNIKAGNWCPKCNKTFPLTLDEMHKLARENGGLCLSTEYINATTKLKWQCKEGHEWYSKPQLIKAGHWCPKCAGVEKLTLKQMKDFARKKGGECLSEVYINIRSKLSWKCNNGHVWEATPGKIVNGHQWCPYCSSGTAERVCRAFFEKIFKHNFPKRKPYWLLNSRGNLMELDGYNEKLNIAFEYQGQQHYSLIKHFYVSNEDLVQRQEDDKEKNELCVRHSIKLISVPYTVRYEEMGDYIVEKLKELNIEVPALKDTDYLNLDVNLPNKLVYMNKIAHKREGVCLSKHYIGSNSKLRWQCKNGHVWEATPGNVVNNKSWCPFCSLKLAGISQRGNLEQMRKMAAKHEGLCLSTEYINSATPLLWRCKNGHEWYAKPSHILNKNSWCPFCSGKLKKTIEEMRNLALKNGGECLSSNYLNGQSKLLWKCKKGHTWSSSARNVVRGHWCPYCSHTAKLSLEEMHKIAEQHRGKCLSNQYLNNKTNLLWECEKGHTWWAVPHNIKQGQWCPKCYIQNRITKT